jgi:hypothetical protein
MARNVMANLSTNLDDEREFLIGSGTWIAPSWNRFIFVVAAWNSESPDPYETNTITR